MTQYFIVVENKPYNFSDYSVINFSPISDSISPLVYAYKLGILKG